MATTGDERRTDSDIEIKPVYTADDAPDDVEGPGEFPFTRGPYSDMYRGRPWTIRQYAGFASAEETNERFRLLLERGQTGLSVAFDLPTQLGLDSDDPLAAGALIVIEVETSSSGIWSNSSSMSAIESIATPVRPTSPTARGSSES